MSYNLTGAAYGGNITLGNAGLQAGTTTTFSTTKAVDYTNKGQFYTLGVQTNAAAPTLDGATGVAFKPLLAGQSCIYAFYVNTAGVISVIQGPAVATLDLTGGAAAAQFPQADDSRTPFGYVLASASAALAAPWVFGVGNLAAGTTGLTLAFRSIMDFPAQPIVG